MSQALYLKWRPQIWDEVVGQEHIIDTLRNAVHGGRVAHAYLFAGPRGTGKTTTARLLAKAVNCLAESLKDRPDNGCENCIAVNEGRFLDLIEIDAASNTSVEDVRDLREKINFSPNQGRFKVYIIDEVHMLSTAAFNALLKTLEEPPPHAIFILATTEVHKIPATVLSRCQRHEFRRLPVSTISTYLQSKVEEDELDIEEQALEFIARQATGSLRDAISLLDQLTSTGETVTLNATRSILGTVSLEAVRELLDALVDKDATQGLKTINQSLDRGADPRQFAREVVDYLRGLLMIQMQNPQLVDVPTEVRDSMTSQADRLSSSDLLIALKAFNTAATDSRASWLPALRLELAFLEACRMEKNEPELSKSSPDAPNPRSAPTSTPSKSGVEKPLSTDLSFKESESPGFQTVRTHWREILQATRQFDPRTQALLNSSTPLGMDESVLILGFRSDLLREKMEKDHNLSNARRAAQQVLGYKVTLRCVLLGAWRSDIKVDDQPPPMEEGGMVATAVRDFGAHVVDVEKLPPEK
jgi:DNA polymerase-3 subunit gamma/tau